MSYLVRAFFFILVLSTCAMAQVWPHEQGKVWTTEVEQKYSAWIINRVDGDILSKPGTFYYQLKVDCADFQYLLRIIFARDNGLEFAINDPTSAAGVLSSKDTRFNHIRDFQERARRFSQRIFDLTSTQTLPRDTVLVAMTRESLVPGTILLGDLKRGHSTVIKKIKPSGIPELLYGNLPADEHVYTAYHFPDPLNYFPMGPITVGKGGGFRRFRWPQDLKKDYRNVSYSSDDQMRAGSNIKTFFDDVQSAVRVQPVTADENINYLIDDLCSQVRVRVNTITDANNFINENRGKKLSYAEDDRFSTYKRDESIRILISKLTSEYRGNADRLSTETQARYSSTFNPKAVTGNECFVEWAQNCAEPLGWIIKRFQSNEISSHAADTMLRRWGFELRAQCVAIPRSQIR